MIKPNLDRLGALIAREVRQILRDRQLLFLLLFPPTVQIVIFGFALNPIVRDVRLGIVDDSQSATSRELVAAFANSGSFRVAGFWDDQAAKRALRRGSVSLVLVVPPDFERTLARGGDARVQMLVDATDANTAGIARSYATRVVDEFSARRTEVRASPVEVRSEVFYNPGLKSSWFFVPGVLGVVLTLTSILVASSAVVREKDTGTLEQLLMTPAAAWEILLAKAIPLFVLLMGESLVALAVGAAIFGVPLRGPFALYLLLSALYSLVGIGTGALMAALARDWRQTQLIAFFVNLPLIQLSGAIAPIESLHPALQWLSLADPLRHYVEIARALLLRGVGLDVLWPHALALAMTAALLLTLAARAFRRSPTRSSARENPMVKRLFAGGLALAALSAAPAPAQTLADLAKPTTAADALATPTVAPAPAPTNPNDLAVRPIEPTMPELPESPAALEVRLSRELTLDQALTIALERNPQLLIGRLAVEKAEAGLRQAEAGLFPTLSLSGAYTYTQSPQSTIISTLIARNSPQGGGFANSVAPTETATASVLASLNWTIYSSGLIPSRIRAADEGFAAARFDYERIRQDVLSETIAAYYNLQLAEGNVTIAEAAVRSAQSTLADTQAQERQGLATRFARLQAEVQLVNARQDLLRTQNERTVRQRTFARLLNFEQPTAVSLADPIARGSDWELRLEQSILEAYNRRPEIAQQRALERAARAQEEAAVAATAPQVSLFATAQTYDNTIDLLPGLYSGYSGGAQISWTAFDGGASRAQAAQAATDARTARARIRDLLATVRLDVETYFSQKETADRRIEATALAVESAEESLRLARLRFRAGLGTQTDVVLADRDLTQARINRLAAIVDYNQAVALLRRALGIL